MARQGLPLETQGFREGIEYWKLILAINHYSDLLEHYETRKKPLGGESEADYFSVLLKEFRRCEERARETQEKYGSYFTRNPGLLARLNVAVERFGRNHKHACQKLLEQGVLE